MENLYHARLPFHTHSLSLSAQALNSSGEKARITWLHVPQSTDVLLGAEQVIDKSSLVDGLMGRVRQVLLGMMKCS